MGNHHSGGGGPIAAKITGAFNSIKHGVEHTVHDIGHTVQHAGKKLGDQYKKEAQGIAHAAEHAGKKIGHAAEHAGKKVGHALEDHFKKEWNKEKQKYKKFKKTVQKVTEGVEVGGGAVLKTVARIPGVKQAANVAADAVNKIGEVEHKLDDKLGGALSATSGLLTGTPGIRAGIALVDVAAKDIKKGKFNVKDLQEVVDSAMAPMKNLSKYIDKKAEQIGVPESVREHTTQLAAMETEHIIAPLVTPDVSKMVDDLHEGNLVGSVLEGGKVFGHPVALGVGGYVAVSGQGAKKLHEYNKLKRERMQQIKDYKKKLAAFKKLLKSGKLSPAQRRALYIAYVKKMLKSGKLSPTRRKQLIRALYLDALKNHKKPTPTAPATTTPATTTPATPPPPPPPPQTHTEQLQLEHCVAPRCAS